MVVESYKKFCVVLLAMLSNSVYAGLLEWDFSYWHRVLGNAGTNDHGYSGVWSLHRR